MMGPRKPWTGAKAISITAELRCEAKAEAQAQVAQLVEHVTENHGVGGSIPPLGTIASLSEAKLMPNPFSKS
jgi:hypothetical protein